MQYQQKAMRTDSEEFSLSYALLRKSINQHSKLKVDIQIDFTTRNKLYLTFRPQTLHLLEKYSNIAAPKIPVSEGSLFAKVDVNKGNGKEIGCNNRGRDDKTYDKKYY